MDIGLALAGVFIVALLLLHDPWLSLLMVACVAMVEVEMLGVMKLWDISLNAVSVTNLVMAIGISIEFCAHVAYAFSRATGTRDERAHKALVEMGSAVFSGITLTKFFGVLVLAFSQSQIFQVYYFRMYLAIVVLGAFHGYVSVIFLEVKCIVCDGCFSAFSLS